MGAADVDVIGLGQADNSGDRNALWLEVFGGEVLNLLDHKLTIFDTMTTKRALAGAKSAKFPIYGDASASYHTPGEDILDTANSYLSQIAIGDRLIHADKVLQASEFVDDLEETLNYWDHRSAIASKLATAMAETVEDRLFRLVVKGSGDAAADDTVDVLGNNIAEWPTGTEITAGTTATAIFDGLYEFAESLDTKNVSRDGRFAVVRPSDFYALLRVNNTTSNAQASVIHGDFVGSGINGDLAKPALMGIWVGGIFVMMSNGIPTTDLSTQPEAIGSDGNDYRADMDAGTTATDFRMLAWQKEAVGTVKVKEPKVTVTNWPNRLGTQITVSQAMGHNVLRPECCGSMTAG